MSYKFNESNTTTLERPTTQTQVADLVDKRVQENSVEQIVSEVEKEVGRFDSSHKAENLNQVYNEIDRQAIAEQTKKPEGLVNPFMGSSNALSEMHDRSSFKDLVSEQESPTLEIKTYDDRKKKNKKRLSSRMKLWIATGACCVVMLVGLVVCNALSIGTIERDIASTESTLARQEVEIEGLEGKISSEANTTPSGMSAVEGGVSVDIAPVTSTEIVTSDNFFNKLARFISYLLGR